MTATDQSTPAATRAAWVAAMARDDAEGLRDLLTDDYEVWSHGAPALRGRAAAVAAMQGALTRFRVEQSFEASESIIAGDWAFERGIETITAAPRDGGPSQTRSQRALLILHRGDDGRWRFARGMTNGLPASE